MATRIFGIIIWSAYMVLTLYYRGILLDMAQRASDAGAGVSHVFFLGTGFGIMLASAFFMTVLAIKSLVSYLINIHKKNKQARLGAKESTVRPFHD